MLRNISEKIYKILLTNSGCYRNVLITFDLIHAIILFELHLFHLGIMISIRKILSAFLKRTTSSKRLSAIVAARKL